MLTDEAFTRLVAEDVKNKVTSDQGEYLRLPDNHDRWRVSLNELVDNLDEQIQELNRTDQDAERRFADMEGGSVLIMEMKVGNDERRTKINRFRFYVEQRVAEVDRMIALGDEALTDDIKLASFLSKAIKEHKLLMEEYRFDPTPIDVALWAALEGKWNFNEVEEAVNANF